MFYSTALTEEVLPTSMYSILKAPDKCKSIDEVLTNDWVCGILQH